MKKRNSGMQLISHLYFRLLPIQILLAVVSAVNGLVSGLFGSNFVGSGVMTAIGLYGPVNHLLYAVCITLASGSQILYGR